MKDILSWFDSIKAEFEKSKEYVSIHVEEFLPAKRMKKKKILSTGIEFYQKLVEKFENEAPFPFTFELDLEIKLLNDSAKLQGVPRNLKTLIPHIDKLGSPELCLYTPEKHFDMLEIEYYKSRLPFKITGLSDSVECHYIEYRTMEELIDKEEYTRWVVLRYFHIVE